MDITTALPIRYIIFSENLVTTSEAVNKQRKEYEKDCHILFASIAIQTGIKLQQQYIGRQTASFQK